MAVMNLRNTVHVHVECIQRVTYGITLWLAGEAAKSSAKTVVHSCLNSPISVQGRMFAYASMRGGGRRPFSLFF